ncbi:MAG: hypothetical protein BWZ10_03260 [candidate division BRC1 bacterium ADurb.BinA364]|nr:MAG: hypothetical protein BWZ10_03260 [candidate division BRC1 bacterium ADurb.BinA364]
MEVAKIGCPDKIRPLLHSRGDKAMIVRRERPVGVVVLAVDRVFVCLAVVVVVHSVAVGETARQGLGVDADKLEIARVIHRLLEIDGHRIERHAAVGDAVHHGLRLVGRLQHLNEGRRHSGQESGSHRHGHQRFEQGKSARRA